MKIGESCPVWTKMSFKSIGLSVATYSGTEIHATGASLSNLALVVKWRQLVKKKRDKKKKETPLDMKRHKPHLQTQCE